MAQGQRLQRSRTGSMVLAVAQGSDAGLRVVEEELEVTIHRQHHQQRDAASRGAVFDKLHPSVFTNDPFGPHFFFSRIFSRDLGGYLDYIQQYLSFLGTEKSETQQTCLPSVLRPNNVCVLPRQSGAGD